MSVEQQNEEYLNVEVKFALTMHFDILKKFDNDEEFKNLEIEERYNSIVQMEEYKEFFSKYPLVCRYMVQLQIFNPRAFKKYLRYLNTVKPTEQERVECMGSSDIVNKEKQLLWQNKVYAQYVKFLYLETNNTHNVQEARRQYQIALDALNKDTKFMFKMYKEGLKKAEEKKTKNASELREELRKSFKEEVKKSELDNKPL